MHIGFFSKKLTYEELRDKIIYVRSKDRVILPPPGEIFLLNFEEEKYQVILSDRGFIEGLELWFDSLTLKRGDVIIITRYHSGYLLASTSPIVKSQIRLLLEMRRIQQLTTDDILCPNCYYSLEKVTLPKKTQHSFKLQCARCGFILVRTIIGGYEHQ